ncbi:MAG: ribokinase, partial [Methylococcales bacterium]|nr:ribokinase [Methylococcales bacterium]
VDTTAAGDAFVAGFSVAVAEGKTLSEAVRFAAATGALTTTKLGAQPSLPTRLAVDSL